MRSADPFRGFPLKEIWVMDALDELSSALIGRIAHFATTQIRKAEQAGCVGIIHHERVSIAVDFVCPDPSGDSMLNRPMLLDSRAQRGKYLVAGDDESSVAQKVGRHFAKLDQSLNGKQIGRNEEWIDARVIGGPEHGKYHADRTRWIAKSMERNGVRRSRRLPQERVWPRASQALLLAERVDDRPRRGLPLRVKGSCLPGLLPVAVG